jgi:hypothetical protein
LQHFEINFYGKNEGKIVIFGNFEMSPRCHGNRKFETEYVVTKAMVQSTFVLILISIVTGGFSMKTAIFSQYAYGGKG